MASEQWLSSDLVLFDRNNVIKNADIICFCQNCLITIMHRSIPMYFIAHTYSLDYIPSYKIHNSGKLY